MSDPDKNLDPILSQASNEDLEPLVECVVHIAMLRQKYLQK